MDDKFFEKLKEKIQLYYEDGSGHGFDHTQRVLNSAITISKNENVDLDVVKAAAILHDIARAKEDKKEIKCHAEEGAKIARKILEEMSFPKEKINGVCHAIEVHRYSKGLKPETREAEIIQDADRLDALGAMIIARVFSFDGKHNIPLHIPDIAPKEEYKPYGDSSGINHFREKILKIKPGTFKTKKAKEIARGRYGFIEEFIERFLKEWDGEL